MGFKITLDGNFTGEHMGLVFTHGTAHTEDAFLASRLRSKGYTVSAAEARKIPLEEMTVPLLKEHAAKNGIDLGGARNKPEIISAIYAAEAAKSETEQ